MLAVGGLIVAAKTRGDKALIEQNLSQPDDAAAVIHLKLDSCALKRRFTVLAVLLSSPLEKFLSAPINDCGRGSILKQGLTMDWNRVFCGRNLLLHVYSTPSLQALSLSAHVT